MTLTREMLEASPVSSVLATPPVAEAIDACLTSQQTCVSCADSCLAEDDVVELRRCAALCLDCADACTNTVRVLSRRFEANHRVMHYQLRECVAACTDSAEECERHAAHHHHCAVCARACRSCLRACQTLLEAEAFEQLEKLAGG